MFEIIDGFTFHILVGIGLLGTAIYMHTVGNNELAVALVVLSVLQFLMGRDAEKHNSK